MSKVPASFARFLEPIPSMIGLGWEADFALLASYTSLSAQDQKDIYRFITDLARLPVDQERIWQTWREAELAFDLGGPLEVTRLIVFARQVLGELELDRSVGRIVLDDDLDGYLARRREKRIRIL